MSTTVQTFPASLGEVLANADATLTNPDVTRTRANITVAQAIQAEERAVVERSVAAQFPVVAAFLADEHAREHAEPKVEFLEGARLPERPVSHVLAPDAPGHFPWCGPGKCYERRYSNGEVLIEHGGESVSLPIPSGMSVAHGELLSAELYENSDGDGATLSLNSGGEGVALDSEDVGRVIEDLAMFLDALRHLYAQMSPVPAEGATAGGACVGLGGACVADHSGPVPHPGDAHCDGPPVTMAGPYGAEFPAVHLSQWEGDAPRIVVGESTGELNLSDVDQLLTDLRGYEARILAVRAQLAGLSGGGR
ncbi:hypothetical protein T45_01433 [Streptomyces turgidiscabies]|nr:hypothetical protein T45_01433 [Streptomyces turgidiscabies]